MMMAKMIKTKLFESINAREITKNTKASFEIFYPSGWVGLG